MPWEFYTVYRNTAYFKTSTRTEEGNESFCVKVLTLHIKWHHIK